MKVTKKTCVTLIVGFALSIASTLQAQQQSSSRVDSFTLVDAETGDTLAVYPNDNAVNTVTVSPEDADGISIRFDTSNASRVRISGVTDEPRFEGALPFSLLGDNVTTYTPWSPEVGTYTIEVDPFAADGSEGQSTTLRFIVREAIEEPAPDPVQEPRPVVTDVGRIMPSINYLLLNDDGDGSTYTLRVSMLTSAGVFDAEDRLLRTLWTHQRRAAGTHTMPEWDGRDDDGNNVESEGATIKVIANNIEAQWEGVIGNTSNSFTGREVINHFNPYQHAITIDGRIYLSHDYSERDGSVTALDWSDLQTDVEVQFSPRIHPATTMLAYDGTHIYMGSRGGNAQTEDMSFVSASTIDNLHDNDRWLPFQGDQVQIFNEAWNAGDLIKSELEP